MDPTTETIRAQLLEAREHWLQGIEKLRGQCETEEERARFDFAIDAGVVLGNIAMAAMSGGVLNPSLDLATASAQILNGLALIPLTSSHKQ